MVATSTCANMLCFESAVLFNLNIAGLVPAKPSPRYPFTIRQTTLMLGCNNVVYSEVSNEVVFFLYANSFMAFNCFEI